jgi:hypothetical protein
MNASARAAAAAMSVPLALEGGTSPLLQRAWAAYREQAQRAAELAACKLELLQYYDVPAMQRAVNICYWGRSGSFLLASYLDGHDQAVMLPQECAAGIYRFWGEFASLTVWEKLLTYPTYVTNKYGPSVDFFAGEYAIESVHYYAAVHALFVAYGDRPGAWLDTRQRFFQLLHVAYALARGQRPADPRPLIVYAQHKTDEELAQLFRADFPQGLFIHTIRDPISTVDSWFERQVAMQSEVRGHRLDVALRYVHPATETMRTLLRSDRPYLGMEARTCAIRFEDLHLQPEATMRRLAPWLGIAFRSSMLESTFNGRPFVWRNGDKSWVGANPSNAQRRSNNLNRADRMLIFALLQRNFLAWGYPMPRAFRSKTLCLAVLGLLWLLPMKIERITAQLIVGRQAWPALRRGKVRFACGAGYFLLMLRARMMRLLAREGGARLAGKRPLLQPL